jgi:hypothetical protein
MRAIYERVRSLGIEYIVCERGALPGSVFFDPLGFNGESGSYDPDKWRRELSQEEVASLSAYVSHYKVAGDSLEDQPKRIGAQGLKRKLGLAPGRKVLFVPLQRPTDSVIEHLCGPIGSYENFLRLIRRLVFCLPPEWEVVVKRHPLEVESPDLPGVYFGDQFHINDLISASDAILLINSGVGVLGLLYEKPVLYTGRAFYGHEGISRSVVDEVEVLDAISNFKPNIDLVRQFLYYLIFEFYSFAEFTTRRVSWRDGSLMTATTAIDYRVIRMPQCPEMRFERRTEPLVGRSSILFDRYRAEVKRSPTGIGAQKSMGKQPEPPQASRGGTVTGGLVASSTPKQRRPVVIRKLIKLKNNPTMFFRDSRFAFLRWIGWSIQKL